MGTVPCEETVKWRSKAKERDLRCVEHRLTKAYYQDCLDRLHSNEWKPDWVYRFVENGNAWVLTDRRYARYTDAVHSVESLNRNQSMFEYRISPEFSTL